MLSYLPCDCRLGTLRYFFSASTRCQNLSSVEMTSLSSTRDWVGHIGNMLKQTTLNSFKIALHSELFFIIIIIIWGANHPYSQLRAELQRTRLQRVREAGMQGRLWLPATSTHNDHEAQPKIESVYFFFPEGRKPYGLENPRGTAENQRTTQLTCGPGRESNRGHLGERRALYAQANHATQRVSILFGLQTQYVCIYLCTR